MTEKQRVGDEPFYLPSSAGRGPPSRHRSSSPGIFGKIGLVQPSLHISLVEDVFFLHPGPPEQPSEDEMIRGTVTLFLPKARSLKHLTVRLVGRYDIGWPDSSPYESGVCLERTVSLIQEGEDAQLGKGEHTFEFIIIVPASAACYERCQYGRVRHTITAKAKGLGPMGGDIVSSPKDAFLICNPGLEDVSKPPPPLHLKFEGSLEEIGPYSIAMQSAYCMVGGLLLFRLNLLFPPTDLLIYSIKVKIVQAFELRSPVDKEHTCSPPPWAQTVFILDSAHPPNMAKISEDNASGAKSGMQTPRLGPLKALRKDEMYRLHHLARLPNDNHIRPSTQEGTITPISCHHTIQCEITYRPMTEEESNPPPFDAVPTGKKAGKDKEKEKKEPERRKVVMSKPFDIFSCCCFLDSLTLPVYSLLDPNPTPLDAELQLPCVCSYKMKQLVELHATNLLVEGSDATIEYVAQPKPEGIIPSPSPRLTDEPGTIFEEGEPIIEEAERGRPASRQPRDSPSDSGSSTPAHAPSSRAQSTSGGFFRVGSSSDRLFSMSGWRQPSTSREGSRAPSRAPSRTSSPSRTRPR
ncbi:hypothetical protein DMC30DRAFT_416925 [Rhodotorula diobovata]|uniref:Arrestin-like N-terminal domain-containing protein n=1 Tax=Rhodotorula diobovata TaxID=5288 RepID=A0A5C5FWD4_9BASI|nr:hypothetical protein DMC30DRAFT_416925 [Rhodotorula diobovata]